MGNEGQEFEQEESTSEKKDYSGTKIVKVLRSRLKKETVLPAPVGTVSVSATPAAEEPPPDREAILKEIEEAAKAVNEGSKHVAGFFTAFLLVTSYIVITVGSTTHIMLLLESSLPLPILGVSLPLKAFYIVVPMVYVVLHLNLILHMRMLDDQVQMFEASVRKLPDSEADLRDRNRKLLFPFFINRALVRFDEPSHLAVFFRVLFWFTVDAVPILTLLFVQLQFLPYHSVAVTWTHRLVLLTDLIVLRFGWRYVASQTQVGKYRRLVGPPRWFQFGFNFVVMFFAAFWLTVPDEYLDTAPVSSTAYAKWRAMRSPLVERPEEIDVTQKHWTEFDVLRRNLSLEGEIIGRDLPPVKDRIGFQADDGSEEKWLSAMPILDVTGRDFRYADFSRSTLYKATFSGCVLDHASFISSTLKDADFFEAHLFHVDMREMVAPGIAMKSAQCFDVNFDGGYFDGGYFRLVEIKNSHFTNASLRECDFSESRLEDIETSITDFEGSTFVEAKIATSNLVFESGLARGCDFRLSDLTTKQFPHFARESKSRFPLNFPVEVYGSPDEQDRSWVSHLLEVAKASPWDAFRIWKTDVINSEDPVESLLDQFKKEYQEGSIVFPPTRVPDEFRNLRVEKAAK